MEFPPLNCISLPALVNPPQVKYLKDSLNKLDSLVEATKYSDPERSLINSRKALIIARTLKTPDILVHAYTLAGLAFSKINEDSSFYYFNKGLKLADSAKIENQKPYLLYNCATLNFTAKDFKQAIVLLDSCIKVASQIKDYAMIARAYNQLGTIDKINKDKADAIKMFDSANIIATRHLVYREIGVSLGNIALFENDPNKALKIFKEAIKYLRMRKGSEEGIARILINMGNRTTNPDTALFYYNEALKISRINHLAEVEMGAYNDMVYSYLDKKDIKGAELCLTEHAIPLAQKEKNDDWLATLSDTYAEVLGLKGDYKEAAKWQKIATVKRLAADTAQASEQVRLLGVLLDLKNKELTIRDNKQELLIQQNRLQKTRLGLTITIFMIIGFVFIILWLQQRNKVKLQVQQIQSAKRIIEIEEDEKQKIARELHDITGQLVLGITGEIENLELPDDGIKEEIKGKIKELGKSIRRISHRMNKAMLDNFTFEELILGQCEDIQKVVGLKINLEMPEEPLILNEEVVLHSYRIVQELLTNAGKYAKDSYINLVFRKTASDLIINYNDNGPGFDSSNKGTKSMGLMNIYERAKLLNGSAEVISSPGDGTSWEIKFPIIQQKTKTI